MIVRPIFSKLLLNASVASLALGSFATAAAAQETPAVTNGPSAASSSVPADPTPSAVAPATNEAEPDTIVVTGTLFRRANTETPSPVTVLTTQVLERANITTVNDAIRSVSADSAGSISTGFRNGFSAGGAAVSLRGLGVSSTVVLIDGLRSANFPLNDDGHNAYVDLNSIPFSIVDRVEVLKDGASSTYGADAIGGVVNLITRKHVTGIDGSVQGGTTQRGDGSHYRATLTAGYGDYEEKGFNIYVNGEYTHDDYIRNHDIGYPFNTLDLARSGLTDKNRNDDSLTTSNPQAVVTRVTQSDLNNPLAGQVGSPLTNQYQLLNPASCANGTFTVNTAAAAGTGCKNSLPDQYYIVQPKQERYSASGRVSVRVNDDIEAYATGMYSHDRVSIVNAPQNIRQTQPFGASASLASSSPGIVLPVYVCAAGTNCATATDRRLNPNNPYAAAFAGNPAAGAARIYYLFGDIPFGSDRTNEVYRGTAGLSGKFGDGYDFRVEGVYARDNFSITNHGYLNIAGLLNAINTGAYNFVNPGLNTQAVRDQIAPDRTTDSHSTEAAIDASISKAFFALPGGDLNVAIGGQVRHETLVNNSANPTLDTYNLNTSAAFGKHTISAAYFEIDAPILDILDVNASGRYDHYSEGYNHFSPKIGVKFTPIRQIAFRGTFSKGFRAPTFAESNPASSYAGFAPLTPPDRVHRSARRQLERLCDDLQHRHRIGRQFGPQAGDVAQLHDRHDHPAGQLVQLHRRLLQHQEVEADRQRSAARCRDQRLLRPDDRRRRLRRARRGGPGLFVQRRGCARSAVPERAAAPAGAERAIRERELRAQLRPGLRGHRNRTAGAEHQVHQPRRGDARAQAQPRHAGWRRREVCGYARAVRAFVGQRHAEDPRQLAEHAGGRRLLADRHGLLRRQDQAGCSGPRSRPTQPPTRSTCRALTTCTAPHWPRAATSGASSTST